MLADYSLTLQEYSMANEVTLAEIHRVVLNFLQNRTDSIVFGAQAVNLYVDEPRMTQDVDVMSTIAAELSELIRSELHQKLHIAARVRSVANEKGFGVFQLRSPSNRHLVDIRQVDELLPYRSFEGILVVDPDELVVLKLVSLASRPNTPKGMTDRADLLRLLLAYPSYRTDRLSIDTLLKKRKVSDEVIAIWESVVSSDIQPDADDY
jgi:hypothetical protein